MKKQFKHYIIVPSLCHSRADGNPGKITDGYRFRPNFLTSKASSENGSALVVQRYDREDGLLPARNAISLQAGKITFAMTNFFNKKTAPENRFGFLRRLSQSLYLSRRRFTAFLSAKYRGMTLSESVLSITYTCNLPFL